MRRRTPNTLRLLTPPDRTTLSPLALVSAVASRFDDLGCVVFLHPDPLLVQAYKDVVRAFAELRTELRRQQWPPDYPADVVEALDTVLAPIESRRGRRPRA